MSYKASDLARVLKILVDNNVKFIIIGDTCVQLALGKVNLMGDVDLFIIEPSIFDNEEFYINIARRFGLEYSYTEIGTPRLVASTDDREIVIELYENYMDIDIPEPVLNKYRLVTINGVRVKTLHPEQYFVLKARQGVDLDKLKQYFKELKHIDYKLMKDTLDKYPGDERRIILERLEEIGLSI